MHFSTSSLLVLINIFSQCTLNETFVLNVRSLDTSPSYTSTKLQFGIPTFGSGKKDDKEDSESGNDGDPPKKIGFSGLAQLITAGMGSPFLGNFEGVEEGTGKMMFSLEANNLVDEVRQPCAFALWTCVNKFTLSLRFLSITGSDEGWK